MRDHRHTRYTPQKTRSDYDYLTDCMASCRFTPLYSTTRAYGTPGRYRCLQDSSQKSLSQGQRGSRFIKSSVHLSSVASGIHICPWCLWTAPEVPLRFWLLSILFFFFLIREDQTHSAWVLILSRGEQPDGKRWGGNTLRLDLQTTYRTSQWC